jgi:hypothetical protein
MVAMLSYGFLRISKEAACRGSTPRVSNTFWLFLLHSYAVDNKPSLANLQLISRTVQNRLANTPSCLEVFFMLRTLMKFPRVEYLGRHVESISFVFFCLPPSPRPVIYSVELPASPRTINDSMRYRCEQPFYKARNFE